jgi:hypothetical protein
MKQIKGFVIVPPGDAAHAQFGYWTFAPTAQEAWYRKLGSEVPDMERPYRIQAWHNRGHRLREATLTIHPGEDEIEATNGKPSNPNLHEATHTE